MTTHVQSVSDDALEPIASQRRRRMLQSLGENGSVSLEERTGGDAGDDSFPDGDSRTGTKRAAVASSHDHLPKPEADGILVGDLDRNAVTPGPAFDAIESASTAPDGRSGELSTGQRPQEE